MDLIYGESVSGTYYLNNKGLSKEEIVIVALGVPSLSQVDHLDIANHLMKAGYDILVPDYSGFCRSGGFFNPKDCIKTVIKTIDICIGSAKAYHVQKKQHILLDYKKVHCLGISFGGSVVASTAKYRSKISSIAMFSPILDFKSHGIEKTDTFIENLSKNRKYLYRGIDKQKRRDHFMHKSGISPYETLLRNKDIPLFISHGKYDNMISYIQSDLYFQSIKNLGGKQSASVLSILDSKLHGYRVLNLEVYKYIERLSHVI